jgi:hypothetical protein
LQTIRVGAAYEFGPTTGEPAGFGADANGLQVQSLAFALDPSSGLDIVDVSTEDRGRGSIQEVQVFGGAGLYEIGVSSPGGASPLSSADPRAVDVNGQPAHLGCLGSERSTHGFRGCRIGGIAWQYAPGAWVTIAPDGPKAEPAELIRIARALDFTASTPVRVPFSIAAAPTGMSLFAVDAGYQAANGDGLASEKPIRSDWSVLVDYRPAASTDDVVIDAAPAKMFAVARGRAVTVDGHAARWNSVDHVLSVDIGTGLDLEIDGPGTWTLDNASALAATIRTAPHPDDLTTWFDATDALP